MGGRMQPIAHSCDRGFDVVEMGTDALTGDVGAELLVRVAFAIEDETASAASCLPKRRAPRKDRKVQMHSSRRYLRHALGPARQEAEAFLFLGGDAAVGRGDGESGDREGKGAAGGRP